MGQETFARDGQAGTMRTALEEGDVQPILECSYSSAHRGFLNAERLSGLTKPEMLRDRQAVEQPGEIQVRNRSRFSARNHNRKVRDLT